MPSFKKIRDLGDYTGPPPTGDYLPVASNEAPEVTKKSTIKDVIDSYNTEKTKEALEAAGLPEDAITNPTTDINPDPDSGGGVQVGYDADKKKCVVKNDPPLTIGNFRQIIDPMGGLQLTPVYGTADSEGCRSYTYQLGVSTGTSTATEFVLLLGKHPELDIRSVALTKKTVRGDFLHGNDPADNDGTLGTAGVVFDSAPTTTSFITNLAEEVDDIYNGRQLLITSGPASGGRVTITGYDGATKKLTFNALTVAPTNDDTFTIIATLSYQATIDEKLETGFILRGVTSNPLAQRINNGNDIIFNDNTWKQDTGPDIGWPKEIYCDNWFPQRTTVKLKYLMEYSPTPINRGNPHEYAPQMTPIVYNSVAPPYNVLKLVTYQGESYLARRTIPAGGVIPFDGNNVNTEYWTKVDNSRPWSFNQIVIHNGAYYIAKNPGGSGVDPTNTDDWHQITTTDDPLIDQLPNSRGSAYYYNRNYYGMHGGYERNVVLQPFISFQGLRNYIARHLSSATRITILLRDPHLKVQLADTFYAAYRTGLSSNSVMTHSSINLSKGRVDFYSPISGKPRILEYDPIFWCTGGNVSIGESSFDILFWFNLQGDGSSYIQNLHFKINAVGGASAPHFNITRFDNGGGAIGECIWDFSGMTQTSSDFNILQFYSGGKYWNFNSVHSIYAYETRGPNGTFSYQTLMEVKHGANFEAAKFHPCASAEPIKFAHEVIGHPTHTKIGTFVTILNDAKLRHFFWTHTNHGYWDASNSRWRNLPAGANSSTRFMTSCNNVAGYLYQDKTSETFVSSTACQAATTVNLGGLYGLSMAGVGWVLNHVNAITYNQAWTNDAMPGAAFQNPQTWPMPVSKTQGNEKVVTSSTKTMDQYGQLKTATNISYYYPYSAFPRGTIPAPGAAKYYAPTAMGTIGGSIAPVFPAIKFDTVFNNPDYETKMILDPDYTVQDMTFVQQNNETLVYTTAQIPAINNHTAYAAS